jgi:hypothetical protein
MYIHFQIWIECVKGIGYWEEYLDLDGRNSRRLAKTT